MPTWTAAVTLIPSTTAVVVVVVTDLITFETWFRAFSCAFLLFGVQTVTLYTIIVVVFLACVVFLAATVPAIPIACTVVVSVVAVSVF